MRYLHAVPVTIAVTPNIGSVSALVAIGYLQRCTRCSTIDHEYHETADSTTLGTVFQVGCRLLIYADAEADIWQTATEIVPGH